MSDLTQSHFLTDHRLRKLVRGLPDGIIGVEEDGGAVQIILNGTARICVRQILFGMVNMMIFDGKSH